MSRFFLLVVCLWACAASAFLLPSAPVQRSRIVMKAESAETVRALSVV